MISLFVYGTLLCEAVALRVVGRVPAAAPAVLDGYRRFRVDGEAYPGIRKGPGRVDGVIWREIDSRETARLDAFEGEMYRRAQVTVQTSAGESVPAETYVMRDAFLSALSREPWTVEMFEARYRDAFLSSAEFSDTTDR